MAAPALALASLCSVGPAVEPWCESSGYRWLVLLLARFALHRQCPLSGIQLLLGDDGWIARVPPLTEGALSAFLASEQARFSIAPLLPWDQERFAAAVEPSSLGLSLAEHAALARLAALSDPAEPIIVLRDLSGHLRLLLVSAEANGLMLPAGCPCSARNSAVR